MIDIIRKQFIQDRIELYTLTPDKLEFDIRANDYRPRSSFIHGLELALEALEAEQTALK